MRFLENEVSVLQTNFCRNRNLKKNHYVEKHRANRNNRFFKRFFEETSIRSDGKHFKPKMCLRYDKLISNSKHEKIDNFFTHYGEGRL